MIDAHKITTIPHPDFWKIAAAEGCTAIIGVDAHNNQSAANYTSNLYIRNQTLYVHLTSAALRQELMMGREKLVRALNQKVGATVITNIIFR